MGQWDDLLKMLVGANPQDFVTFLLRDARYIGTLDRELKVKTQQADLLFNVEREGHEFIIHAEFQRRRDPTMGERLWKYNVSTTITYGKDVLSFVIYLVEENEVVEPPYLRTFYGNVIHAFQFTNIKLWELSADVFEQPGREGLLPLVPLTSDGKKRERLDEMIQGLQASGKEDLLPLGYVIAGLVLDDIQDKEWLKRRFAMFQERLEDSWAYQEILAKGWEKGEKEGKKEGKEEGQLLALRSTLLSFVQIHFPHLVSVAMARAERIQDPDALQAILTSMFQAKSNEEAQRILTDNGE
ncbi:MAG TPA: hypothetical protein DHW02_04310 [Ktedonobacter sp.]|nr:hypothetical protein [Ktedonobacter sp.]